MSKAAVLVVVVTAPRVEKSHAGDAGDNNILRVHKGACECVILVHQQGL